MNRNLDRVYEETRTLDAASKLILAAKLLSETEPEPGHQQEWNAEIHRRIDDIRLGRVQTEDAFEIIRQAKEQLGM
jgi:hypothetical protein